MSDEQQECQKAKVKMRRLSDEQQECQSTPLLDLAAARLVKIQIWKTVFIDW